MSPARRAPKPAKRDPRASRAALAPRAPDAPRASRASHARGSARVHGRCAVLTVSDTRGADDDGSGDAIQRLLEGAGHTVPARRWVRDDRAAIRRAARTLLRRRDVDALVVTGGTGVAPRDVTPEALEPLYDRALPGFGEQFRARSEAQVGTAAWLSRASAGIVANRLLVLLPGSTRAVTLALSEILLPELGHVLRLLGRTNE